MVVYDPSNYAQNVLQAARALQQINNQVTGLQNQTQMLLNQARNLTSLPYSSMQAIDASSPRRVRTPAARAPIRSVPLGTSSR
jgi:P-type conjugative transfer protein TrbJ